MNWALKNLWAGLKRYNLWSRLALTDIQQIYKRTVFGMSWVAFSFALFVIVKIIIFGSITSVDTSYFAIWLTLGFWVWTFIIASIVDGCNGFVHARSWILGTNLPLSIYIYQTSVKCIIRFIFAMPVVICLLIYFHWTPNINWLWALLGFVALVANGLWAQIFFASVCVKYRDITHLVISFMQVMFFVTPILYVPEQLGDKAYLLNYNPFTHFLAVVRDPIIHGTTPMLAWQVVGAFTLIGWMIALLTFQRMGRHVPFRV